MMSILLLLYCVWKNRTARFYRLDVSVFVVLMTKQDVQFPKPDYPVLAALAYVPPIFICYDSLVMCIMQYMFTH
jgi:hypothetical protein